MAFFLLILLLSFLINTLESFKVKHLRPSRSKEAISFNLAVSKSHLIFTAQTHIPNWCCPMQVNMLCMNVWVQCTDVCLILLIYPVILLLSIILTVSHIEKYIIKCRIMRRLQWDTVNCTSSVNKIFIPEICALHLHPLSVFFV